MHCTMYRPGGTAYLGTTNSAIIRPPFKNKHPLPQQTRYRSKETSFQWKQRERPKISSSNNSAVSPYLSICMCIPSATMQQYNISVHTKTFNECSRRMQTRVNFVCHTQVALTHDWPILSGLDGCSSTALDFCSRHLYGINTQDVVKHVLQFLMAKKWVCSREWYVHLHLNSLPSGGRNANH